MPGRVRPRSRKAISRGSDFHSGAVRNQRTGKTLQAKVLPPKLLDLLQAGGIYPLLEKAGHHRALAANLIPNLVIRNERIPDDS